MKKLFFLLLFTVFVQQAQAQNEAAIWYFGENAGVDFSSGSPVALTDGALHTIEGSATISDVNGNLLFYTDGITIWNRNHDPMPNGTGLNGDPSSTQSAIIVPKSDEPNIYYVFTVDDIGGPHGLQYNVVDMNLDGGLGDVTAQKHVPLQSLVSEKITAVEHSNGNGIWVITRSFGGNTFYSYLVNAAGVSHIPVTTTNMGIALPQNDSGSQGYLKASPDGRLLASASPTGGYLELFRFDPANGTVSNPISLQDYMDDNWYSLYVYGVEFSSNSRVLYASSRGNVFQFDISNYDQAAIVASGLLVTPLQTLPPYVGALQMAIDGKIYTTRSYRNHLNVINDPNVLGMGCNFQEHAISLGETERRGVLGLPPFITSFFYVGVEAENFCLGDGTEFSVNVSDPITTIDWDFGDTHTSTLETPTHTYAAPGDYTVSVTVTTAVETTTETREITIYENPVANAMTDLEICSILPNPQTDLSAKDAEILGAQSPTTFQVRYFATLADAQQQTNALPGLYTNTLATETLYARIDNRNNPACYDTASFDLIVKAAPELHTATDWTVCDTDTDGLYNFNLSQKDTEIFNGQDPGVFSLAYFASQADADANTNALGPSHTNTGPSQPIFYRIYNTAYPECFETGSFQIEVILGVTAHAPTNREVCDDDNDGFHVFDLSLSGPEILGGQNPASIQISYHATQADAENGTDPYDASAYTNTTAYGETVYIRAENISDGSCYDTTSFELRIYDAPVRQTVENWQVCDDDNDGFSTFDLAQKDAEVLGSQSATDFKVTYHLTEAEALAGTNPILGPITNAGNPQEIFYRLESNAHAPCFLTDRFLLEVFDTPTANNPSPIVLCDTNETGLRQIDLSVRDAEILNGQDPTAYEVVYFRTEADALADQNPMPKQNYGNGAPLETLYARVEHRQLASLFRYRAALVDHQRAATARSGYHLCHLPRQP